MTRFWKEACGQIKLNFKMYLMNFALALRLKVFFGIKLYVVFMFQSVYKSQKRQKFRTMKRWLLVKKTRKKVNKESCLFIVKSRKKAYSQESCLFFEGRNICKFIFNLAYIWEKYLIFLHACRKVCLAKSFDIQFMEANSPVKKYFPLRR